MKTITPSEYRALAKPKKPSKYRSIRTELLGRVYDSKLEATKAHELQTMQASGLISGLTYQPEYKITINGVYIGKYIADFGFWENGQEIALDVKSPITAKNLLFRWKLKCARACYPGVTFRLTGKGIKE